MSWATIAAKLPGKCWHVSSALWFAGIRSKNKSALVTLTPKILRYFGLTRQVVYKALQHLEDAGLCRVQRQTGRRLRVVILPAPAKEP